MSEEDGVQRGVSHAVTPHEENVDDDDAAQAGCFTIPDGQSAMSLIFGTPALGRPGGGAAATAPGPLHDPVEWVCDAIFDFLWLENLASLRAAGPAWALRSQALPRWTRGCSDARLRHRLTEWWRNDPDQRPWTSLGPADDEEDEGMLSGGDKLAALGWPFSMFAAARGDSPAAVAGDVHLELRLTQASRREGGCGVEGARALVSCFN